MTTTKYILVAGTTSIKADGFAQWISGVKNTEVTIAPSDERAIELAQQQGYDMVIINRRDENLNIKKLAAIMPILQPEVVLLPYDGEPSNDLKNKVDAAFETRKIERMKRLLVLESSKPSFYDSLLPFSLN